MSSAPHTARKVAATLLGGGSGVLLLVAGASIPADDIIFGDLGPLLVLGGLVMLGLTALAALEPLVGGIALLLLGACLAVWGLAYTPQAGLLFGGVPLVAGSLFVSARRRAG
jgi:hypothetical protein